MRMILWDYRGTIQALVVIALAIVSWRRGAEPERYTVLVLLAMVVTIWIYRYMGLPQMQGRIIGGYFATDLFYALVDAIGFGILLGIALLANRFYPLIMAGLQATALGTHLMNEVAQNEAPLAYAILNIVPFYFMIAAQALGLVFHIRRERRLGPYPSWRSVFDPSPARRRNGQRPVS